MQIDPSAPPTSPEAAAALSTTVARTPDALERHLAAWEEAYLAQAIGGKKRKELRRQGRRLAEAGAVRYDELLPDGDLDA